MYAVIQTGGKQYRVKSGEQVKVESLAAVQGLDCHWPGRQAGALDFDPVVEHLYFDRSTLDAVFAMRHRVEPVAAVYFSIIATSFRRAG